jgi:hypothetical protein
MSKTIEEQFEKKIKTIPNIKTIDQLDDYENRQELAREIMDLNPQDVDNLFGKDLLLWAWLNTPVEQSQESSDAFHSITQTDYKLLEKIRRNTWRENIYPREISKASTVKATHEFSKEFLNQPLQINLEEQLKNSAKDGIIISDKRASDYLLIPVTTIGYLPFGWTQKLHVSSFYPYLDAPFGLVLCYRKQPNAITGFYPIDDKTVLINQIQGIRSKIKKEYSDDQSVSETSGSRGLAVLDWQKLLVNAIIDISKNHGFEKVGIQSGVYNEWVHKKKISLEKAIERYDNLASRLGFIKHKDNNWFYQIS